VLEQHYLFPFDKARWISEIGELRSVPEASEVDLLTDIGHAVRLWAKSPKHALKFYKQARDRDSKSVFPLFFLAMTYKTLGETDKAIAYYTKCLQLLPNFPDVLYNLGNLYHARSPALATTYYKKALVHLAEAKFVNPGKVYFMLAKVAYA
jgi:tetratricopeptide (TPR) repeat protein